MEKNERDFTLLRYLSYPVPILGDSLRGVLVAVEAIGERVDDNQPRMNAFSVKVTPKREEVLLLS